MQNKHYGEHQKIMDSDRNVQYVVFAALRALLICCFSSLRCVIFETLNQRTRAAAKDGVSQECHTPY